MRTSRILVLTGAGISAESGIPTFRGPGGYWRTVDPAKLATHDAFDADPAMVWDWYRERRAAIRTAQPNAAHVALTQLAHATSQFLLVTQNVDDLHRRATYAGAGLGDESIVQIHGDIFVSRCEGCGFSRRDDVDVVSGFRRTPGIDVVSGLSRTSRGNAAPPCPRCAGVLRPGVVWFGEQLDPKQIARVERFIAGGPCDAVIVVGTTAQFGYIVEWAVRGARGGRLVEVNPEATPLSAMATEIYREPAAIALPRIVIGEVM